jgi:membrane-associated phospholipid phosphatase
MAQHRNLADELPTTAAEGPSLALARTLSVVFSPPLVALATYLFVAYARPESFLVGMGWALLSLCIQLIPGGVVYTYRRRTGAITDADISVRTDRNELYLVGTIAVLVSVATLAALQAPLHYQALALGTLGLSVACGLTNLFWKISMHAAAIGAFATIVALHVPMAGAILWGCALAVGWARVKTRNHTPLQVVAGLLVSAAVTYGAFALVVGAQAA